MSTPATIETKPKSILGDIVLTEEQMAVASEQIQKVIAENVDAVKKEYEEKIALLQTEPLKRITEDGKDLILNEEEEVILQAKLTEWKENIEKEVTASLQLDLNSKLNEEVEKVKNDCSKRVLNVIKDLYEDIETSVREKLLESEEFKIFSKVKEIVAPAILEGEFKDTVLEDTKKLKQIITEQAEAFTTYKKKVKLDQLTSDLPEALKPHFLQILSEAKDEDAMVDVFHKNLKMLKDVKNTLAEEFELKNKVESAPLAEAVAPKVEVAPAATVETPLSEDTAIKDKILSEAATSKPEGSKKEAVQENLLESEGSVDYDILTEDFKRVESKSNELSRLLALAGVE